MGINKLFSKELVGATVNKVGAGAKQQAPTLMLIGATLGLGLTVYELWKAKPKCDDILARREEELEKLEETVIQDNAEGDGYEEVSKYTEEEKKKETRKINVDTGVELALALKAPIATAATTIGLMWGANYIHIVRTRTLAKKLADATALYEISNEALKKYKKALGEEVGEEKKEEVEKKIVEEVSSTRSSDPRYVMQWFLDKPTGRVFPSTIAQIENGVADVRLNFGYGEFIEANILYDNWGLEECGFGEKNGWDPQRVELWVKMNETKKLPDGRSVIVLDYDTVECPRYD